MSKASEWAAKYDAAYGQFSVAPSLWVTAIGFTSPSERLTVGPDGMLDFGPWQCNPAEALKIAHWILDTFGETK